MKAKNLILKISKLIYGFLLTKKYSIIIISVGYFNLISNGIRIINNHEKYEFEWIEYWLIIMHVTVIISGIFILKIKVDED